MKTISYLVLLFTGLMMAINVQSQTRTINGLVYNVKENKPQVKHAVSYSSPWSTDTLTTYTNSDGAFSIDIEFNSPDSVYLFISTIDPCFDILHTATIYPFTSSDFVNFKVCSDSSVELNCEARFDYYNGASIDPVFNHTDDSSMSNSVIYFYDQSYGNINSWFWDFGDGSSSTEQNPIHDFAKSGEYLVSLTISGSECKSTIQNLIWAGYVEPKCSAWFYYDFGYYTDSIKPFKDSIENDMLTIYFHEYSSGNFTQRLWDFGDGSSSTEQNPVHTYAAPGEYYVNLNIIGENCINWYGESIWVGNYTPPCQAMFGYDNYSWSDSTSTNPNGDTGNSNTLYFYDYSYGNPTQWKWDFGDGSFSDEQNPKHNFEKDGEYLVSLEIANDSCNSNYSMYVYTGNFVDDSVWILESCQALFYPIIESNNNVSFINQSYGKISDCVWDFGDGSMSTEINPTHQYSNQGEYLVLLTINTFDNCSSKIEMFVWVGESISDSELTALFVPEIVGNKVIFHDKSSGQVENRYWDFGDGTNSISKEPIHIFKELKTYQVTLGISNAIEVRTFTMEINLANGSFKGFFGSEDALSVQSKQNISSLNIYPNPAIDKVSIDFNSQINGIGKIQLFNLSGQLLLEKQFRCVHGLNSNQLYIDLLAKGVYILKLKCGNQILETKKIIK